MMNNTILLYLQIFLMYLLNLFGQFELNDDRLLVRLTPYIKKKKNKYLLKCVLQIIFGDWDKAD